MSDHTLHVTHAVCDVDGTIDHQWTIECPTGTCGYTSCTEGEHRYACDDCAADGWDDCDCDPIDDREFHGVMHTWLGGDLGWSVPYDGCAVRDYTREVDDDVLDIIATVGTGDWIVDADWEWDAMRLTLVGSASSGGAA